MKLPGRWIWLAGLVVMLGLLVAACDDNGDDEDDGGTPEVGDTPSAEMQELTTDFGVSDTDITLGMTIAQSVSPVASVFAPVLPAMQAYFEKVNAEDNGSCGRQITLIDVDDQYAPDLALQGAQKLVQQDEVVAFIGNLGTAAVTGQVDFINDPDSDGDTSDGVPHLFLSTGAAKWDDPERWPWTIGYIPDYISEGSVLADYVNENLPEGSTAGILYQNDEFGEDGRDGFKAAFAGEVISEQPYDAEAVEVNSQMANLRDADPDILLLYSLGLATRAAYVYMEENDWNPQVLSSYVNPTSLIATLIGGGPEPEQLQKGYDQLAGTIQTNYLIDPVADAADPAFVEHVRIMETYGGPNPDQLSLYGQSLAELTIETLRIACANGDMTRLGVLVAAESIQGFRSSVLFPGIEINLSATDHFSIQALFPVEVQSDGTLVAVGDITNVEE